jgi:hypothetical protein
MAMHAPPDYQLHEPRASIRLDARLDATTRQKGDDLARPFHQPRAAVLSHIMHWGLSRGQTGRLDRDDSQGFVRHLSCAVASALYQQVQQAAAAVGVKTAPWLRQMIRQVTPEEFPASWHEGQAAERCHESRRYGTRFMLRLEVRRGRRSKRCPCTLSDQPPRSSTSSSRRQLLTRFP